MKVESVKEDVHEKLYAKLNFKTFRPAQSKSIDAGLLDHKNLVVCTPTASGKTLIAELAMLQAVYNKRGKAIYVVPLKALASEKYHEFKEKYPDAKIALSLGDSDGSDSYLERYDIIITVSEKLDSLIRHKAAWINQIDVVVIDEIHLMNDAHRGPTLEIVLTILRRMLKKAQFIGLSATIGNPRELADWLDAELVQDTWRPIELKKGIYLDGNIEYYS